MKKAEDLCKELNWIIDSDPGRYDLFIGLIQPLIKLAQEDAIRETVGECAKNVLLDYPDWMDCGEELEVKINKHSILSVADKLIKEL